MGRPFEELRHELLQSCERAVDLAQTPGGDPWELVPKMQALLEEVAAFKTEDAEALITDVKDAPHCMFELNAICADLLESM